MYAKQSTVYLRWTVIFASLAFTVSLLGLGVQVMQIFSPVNIATDVDKPIHVQGAEAARESDR